MDCGSEPQLFLAPDSAGLRSLWRTPGARFEPASGLWRVAELPKQRLALTPSAALAWRQRESGGALRAPVSVVGAREASDEALETAAQVGRGLADLGVIVLTGGKSGIMAAVSEGVATAGGLCVGLLPDDHWSGANDHVAVALASGIGVARNAIIARAGAAMIALSGGYGTLSEMAFALQFGRPVFTLPGAPALAGAQVCHDWAELAEALSAALLGLSAERAP